MGSCRIFLFRTTPIFFVLAAFALSACGRKDDPVPSVSEFAVNPDPVTDPDDGTPPDQANPPAFPVYPAATWAARSQQKSWTDAVYSVVRARMTHLEQARDIDAFCPGYSAASMKQREVCWLRLVGAIALYESNYNPSDAFREPSGVYSVGLMSLSTGECRNAPTLEALKDGVKNLVCGVGKMADLIKRHGFIDGPVATRGAAAYWSTLRAPYVQYGYNLGKRDKVIKITETYRRY